MVHQRLGAWLVGVSLALAALSVVAPQALAASCGLYACADADAFDGAGSGDHWARGTPLDSLGTGSGQLEVAGQDVDSCTFSVGNSCATDGEVSLDAGCTTVNAETEVLGDVWVDTDQYCPDDIVGDILDEVQNTANNLP